MNRVAQVLLLVSVLGLSACSPNTVTIRDESGGTARVEVGGGSGQYPPDFPVPQYRDSKTMLSYSPGLANAAKEVKTGEKSRGPESIMLSTNDTPDQVDGFYRDWFNSNGWKVVAHASTDSIRYVTAEKGEQSVIISATNAPAANGQGNTVITIQVQRHSP